MIIYQNMGISTELGPFVEHEGRKLVDLEITEAVVGIDAASQVPCLSLLVRRDEKFGSVASGYRLFGEVKDAFLGAAQENVEQLVGRKIYGVLSPQQRRLEGLVLNK
ncbi:MAG: hypothetical protein Q7R96_06540 [Nanoarchaeota archaeon]|nr:hypothetical protein [Nanoarchaeota archaeon]